MTDDKQLRLPGTRAPKTPVDTQQSTWTKFRVLFESNTDRSNCPIKWSPAMNAEIYGTVTVPQWVRKTTSTVDMILTSDDYGIAWPFKIRFVGEKGVYIRMSMEFLETGPKITISPIVSSTDPRPSILQEAAEATPVKPGGTIVQLHAKGPLKKSRFLQNLEIDRELVLAEGFEIKSD